MSTDDDDDRDRDLWLGDLLRVWRDLGLASATERAAAASALGFDASRLLIDAGATPEPTPAASAAPTAGGPAHAAVPTWEAGTAPRPVPSTLTEDAREAVEAVPGWLADAAPLAAEQEAHARWRPEHAPLLRPLWTRHIVTAMCSTSVPEGPVDAERLTEQVVRSRPVTSLPRRPRPTVRRGAQVLVERGPAMLPFRRDVQQLLTALRTVVGKDQLVVGPFERHPLDDAITWVPGGRTTRWDPPTAGTPVLLVGDLGITQTFGHVRGASLAEWLAFARRCRGAGCPAIALVPHDQPFWPPALARTFTMIPWGHRTTVATVRRALLRAGVRP